MKQKHNLRTVHVVAKDLKDLYATLHAHQKALSDLTVELSGLGAKVINARPKLRKAVANAWEALGLATPGSDSRPLCPKCDGAGCADCGGRGTTAVPIFAPALKEKA